MSIQNSDTNSHIFAHLADIHLAPRQSTIAKRDGVTGRLIRELDMEKALSNAVSDIIGQCPKPFAVVIAGDFFDTYRGNSDAFCAFLREFRRLISAKIHIIGIAGNHDTPTNALKTPMYKMLCDVFAENEYVHLAYDTIEHVIVADTEFVLLPHARCLHGDFTQSDLEPSLDRSVLVVHGVASGDPSLQQMDEAKEVPIAKWILDLGWSYIAFGHYHRPGWIPGYNGKAAYCGSLENTVISGPDVCMRRGPVYVDLEQSGEEMIRMSPLPIRRITTLPDIDITGQDIAADELVRQITETVAAGEIDDAIVIHSIFGITKSLYKSLPQRTFQHVNPKVLYIRTDFHFAEDSVRVVHVAEQQAGEASAADVDVYDDETFMPLDKEVEKAITILVRTGQISANKSEEIKELLNSYVV